MALSARAFILKSIDGREVGLLFLRSSAELLFEGIKGRLLDGNLASKEVASNY